MRWLLALPRQPAIVWLDSFAYDGRAVPPRSPMPPAALRASCHIYGRGYSLPDARAGLLARCVLYTYLLATPTPH